MRALQIFLIYSSYLQGTSQRIRSYINFTLDPSSYSKSNTMSITSTLTHYIKQIVPDMYCINMYKHTPFILNTQYIHFYKINVKQYCVYLSVKHVWEHRGIVVGYHDARTTESLGLMDQHVASFVICIISNHNSCCRIQPNVTRARVDSKH